MGVCFSELAVPLPSPAPSQGTCELGKGRFPLGSKGRSQQRPKCPGLASRWFGGLRGGLGGPCPTSCLFHSLSHDKAKKLSQPLQHVPGVRLAHPNPTATGMGLQGRRAPASTGHPPLGEPGPIPHPWDVVFPVSQHLSVWTQGVFAGATTLRWGTPSVSGCLEEESPSGRSKSPGLARVTSPRRWRKSLPWGTGCPWGRERHRAGGGRPGGSRRGASGAGRGLGPSRRGRRGTARRQAPGGSERGRVCGTGADVAGFTAARRGVGSTRAAGWQRLQREAREAFIVRGEGNRPLLFLPSHLLEEGSRPGVPTVAPSSV